jgi:hypothetical protein
LVVLHELHRKNKVALECYVNETAYLVAKNVVGINNTGTLRATLLKDIVKRAVDENFIHIDKVFLANNISQIMIKDLQNRKLFFSLNEITSKRLGIESTLTVKIKEHLKLVQKDSETTKIASNISPIELPMFAKNTQNTNVINNSQEPRRTLNISG